MGQLCSCRQLTSCIGNLAAVIAQAAFQGLSALPLYLGVCTYCSDFKPCWALKLCTDLVGGFFTLSGGVKACLSLLFVRRLTPNLQLYLGCIDDATLLLDASNTHFSPQDCL